MLFSNCISHEKVFTVSLTATVALSWCFSAEIELMLGKSSFVPGPGGFPPSGTAGTEAQSFGSLMCLSSLAAPPCAPKLPPAKSLQGQQTTSAPQEFSRGRTDPDPDGSTATA